MNFFINATRRIIALALLSVFFSNSPVQASAPEITADLNLTVTFKGLKTANGKVLVRLYTTGKGFPEDKKQAFKSITVEIEKGLTASARFSGLAPGSYAVAAVHDENGSGEMDTNWIGIPREGLGVSRDAKSFMGPPKFKDSVFELIKSEEIEVNFVYL